MISYRNRLWSQLGIDPDRLSREEFDLFMNEHDAALADDIATMIERSRELRDLTDGHMADVNAAAAVIRKSAREIKTEGT